MHDSTSMDNMFDILAARRVQRLTQWVAWLSDRLDLSEPPIVDVNYLRQLPQGTFGRAWIDALDVAGFKPFASGPRRQQLHDGIHILTGYGTDRLGEAEVQAFLLGAKFRLFNLLLLSSLVMGIALVKPIARPVGQSEQFAVDGLLRHLQQAYQRGHQSHLDPDRWQPENLWHLPLKEVQSLFHLENED